MGVTIHYRGKLGPKVKIKTLYLLAGMISKEQQWKITDLVETEKQESLFIIYPHVNCEPLIFQINAEGNFSDQCKTQFAPVEIHKGIISLFDQIKNKFSELVIVDEGGYWETRDVVFLLEQIMNCNLAIEQAKQEDSSYHGPAKTDDGRIVDLMR